jgi:hypothetical protein
MKTLKGPPHQRQTLQHQKLFRHRLRHARACATGNDDQMVFHARAAA